MAAEETAAESPQTPESSRSSLRPRPAETETTEGGFGTGLRAQLKRRREPSDEPQGSATVPEAPIVRVDLYASGPRLDLDAARTAAAPISTSFAASSRPRLPASST